LRQRYEKEVFRPNKNRSGNYDLPSFSGNGVDGQNPLVGPRMNRMPRMTNDLLVGQLQSCSSVKMRLGASRRSSTWVSTKAAFAQGTFVLFRQGFLQARRADKHAPAGLVGLTAQVRLQLTIPDREERPGEAVRRRPADRIDLIILVVHHRRHGELPEVALAL